MLFPPQKSKNFPGLPPLFEVSLFFCLKFCIFLLLPDFFRYLIAARGFYHSGIFVDVWGCSFVLVFVHYSSKFFINVHRKSLHCSSFIFGYFRCFSDLFVYVRKSSCLFGVFRYSSGIFDILIGAFRLCSVIFVAFRIYSCLFKNLMIETLN